MFIFAAPIKRCSVWFEILNLINYKIIQILCLNFFVNQMICDRIYTYKGEREWTVTFNVGYILIKLKILFVCSVFDRLIRIDGGIEAI